MSDDPKREGSFLDGTPRMGLDDRFTFRCDEGLGCFTCCCSDVAIFLTPYDVLRMKRALGLDSSGFLENYTLTSVTGEQKLPVVILKMDPETKRCPFVGPAGCRIYADRPWACRMYPVGVASPKTPTPEERGFHFLLREKQCQGVDQGREWTVREWLESQGVAEYDMMGESFKDLMLHDGWEKLRPLPPDKVKMYLLALYDLDRFRRFVFESSFLSRFEIDEARVEALKGDDEELLDFAIQWLRFSLFNEKTMRVNRSVLEAGRKALAERGEIVFPAREAVERG